MSKKSKKYQTKNKSKITKLWKQKSTNSGLK